MDIRRTLRSPQDLAEAGLIAPKDVAGLAVVAERYAIAAPPALAALVDPADANDPIARQIVPSLAELDIRPGELADPIGDHAHEPTKGLVHRYCDRVLLKVVSVCPVYCRFCFRREMVGPGKDQSLTTADLEAALDYIRAHKEIWEVILTGGDPFMLSAERARALSEALGAIEHVKVIRWHTRMPIADPGRIDDAFCAAISSSSKTVYVALHANHPRELTEAARAACRRLSCAGAVMLSQSVLLRGVNDDIETLSRLMRAFVEIGVRPYYLHHPDLAPGTAQFRVTLKEGQALVRQLRDHLTGLAQPHYVLDIPGGVSKALASLSDVRAEEDMIRLRGRDGLWRDYAEE